MPKDRVSVEREEVRKRRQALAASPKRYAEAGDKASGLTGLQQLVGNRAVQRIIAQPAVGGPAELDEETAARINRERGNGQALDSQLQSQMSAATGYDLSGVRVHTSRESDALSHALSAKAFTTGQDIFFREGAYDPRSTAGQELIGHELIHVVQQSAGKIGGAGKMTVNAPGDVHEQEADALAKGAVRAASNLGAQRQEVSGEEIQMQPAEEFEEEEEQT